LLLVDIEGRATLKVRRAGFASCRAALQGAEKLALASIKVGGSAGVDAA
jgi:hypothetical protein